MERITLLWEETANEAAREILEPIVPVFEVVTHLGDGAFLLVLAVLIYWFGAEDARQDRAFVLAVGTAALALSAGLKGIFQIPRPDVAFAPLYYPGYTFPSAHAMGAAAFYGALAITMTRGRRSMRFAIAGLLIVAISLSRVVMGVHYLGDVVVGSALGLALVGLGSRYRKDNGFDPGPMFVIAAIIAVGGALLGSVVFLSLTIGAAVGGAIGWYIVKDRPTTSIGAAVLVLGVGGIVGILGLRWFSLWLGLQSVVPSHSGIVVFSETIAYILLTIFVLIVPWLALSLERHERIRQLQRVLPFRGRILEPRSRH